MIEMSPCDYSSQSTPTGYLCGECKVTGVRLYREYNAFLSHQHLYCRACAIEETGGLYYNNDPFFRSDSEHQIGCSRTLIAAVPTVEGDTFWGFTSVPQEGVDWWNRLPKSKEKA